MFDSWRTYLRRDPLLCAWSTMLSRGMLSNNKRLFPNDEVLSPHLYQMPRRLCMLPVRIHLLWEYLLWFRRIL